MGKFVRDHRSAAAVELWPEGSQKWIQREEERTAMTEFLGKMDGNFRIQKGGGGGEVPPVRKKKTFFPSKHAECQ